MNILFTYLYDYFFSTGLGIIELIASILTLLCVWQTARQNIWCWITGTLGVIFYGWIFYQVHLYADMTLQLFFFLPMQFYGFWYWATKGPSFDNTPVTIIPETWVLSIPILIVGSVTTGAMFAKFTNAALPYPDSFILWASILAQFLLSQKRLEAWILWIAVDIVAIPVYVIKELYVTASLYTILLVLATIGFFSWYRSFKNEVRPHTWKVSSFS